MLFDLGLETDEDKHYVSEYETCNTHACANLGHIFGLDEAC